MHYSGFDVALAFFAILLSTQKNQASELIFPLASALAIIFIYTLDRLRDRRKLNTKKAFIFGFLGMALLLPFTWFFTPYQWLLLAGLSPFVFVYALLRWRNTALPFRQVWIWLIYLSFIYFYAAESIKALPLAWFPGFASLVWLNLHFDAAAELEAELSGSREFPPAFENFLDSNSAIFILTIVSMVLLFFASFQQSPLFVLASLVAFLLQIQKLRFELAPSSRALAELGLGLYFLPLFFL